MSTLRAVLLGLVVTLSVGVVSSSAAPKLAAISTCAPVEPSADVEGCAVVTAAPAPVITMSRVEKQPGSYRLSIRAATPGGLTRLVEWSPPGNLAIRAITGIENGRCWLSEGRIACLAVSPARSMGVTFTAETVRRDTAVTGVTVTFLDLRRGLYRITVAKTSRLDDGEAFNWAPPLGITITKITGSGGGKCTLVAGRISCHRGNRMASPRSLLTVDFLASGLRPIFNGKYWTYYGATGAGLAQILMNTPVPYHVPTFTLRRAVK
jgi:hypothetical protein